METIEKFRIIVNQYQIPKAFILEYYSVGDKLNTQNLKEKENTIEEFLNLLGNFNFTPDQSQFLKTKSVVQKLKVSESNYEKFKSDTELFDVDFKSDTYSEERENAANLEFQTENKRLQRKSYVKIFSTVFVVVFLFTVLFIWIFKSSNAEIRGVSSDSYIEMDANCGCDSPNGESKRESIFESEYKDKWVTYIGIISSISDDKLLINADLKGVSDLAVEFENAEDIYDLKVGSYIAVKFVLREQGGCFSDYEGDLGKIISNDMVEINKMIKQ